MLNQFTLKYFIYLQRKAGALLTAMFVAEKEQDLPNTVAASSDQLP